MENDRIKSIKLNEFILKEMRQCNLMTPLDDVHFDKIVQTSKVLQLPDNTVLFEQDSQLTYVYLLLSGGIKLQRLAPSGDEKVINIIQPGKTFAEAALLSGSSSYPVSAVTVLPTVVVGFKAITYLELLKGSNELCLNLLGYFSKRLKWMVNEVERLTLHNATFRLVDYLLSQIPEDKHQRTAIILTIPKHVIASRLSIKPETLSRTFNALSKRQLIIRNGSQIEIIDVDKLRQLITLEM